MPNTPQWARPFRLHLVDGRTWHGVQFPHVGDADSPNGFVCVYTGEYGGAVITAMSFDGLITDLRPGDPLIDARVEWPDGNPNPAQSP